MYRAFIYGVLVVAIILTTISVVDARRNRTYTLHYTKKDGTMVIESYRSIDSCCDQEMYLKMVEKESIITRKCR